MRRRSSAVPPDIPVDPFGKRRPTAFRERTHRRHEQAQILHESFGAIKEIIVLQAQYFFRGRFERATRSFSLAAAFGQVVSENPRYLMECVGKITGSGTYDGLLKSAAVFRRMTGVR
jgi:hypothetical protein